MKAELRRLRREAGAALCPRRDHLGHRDKAAAEQVETATEVLTKHRRQAQDAKPEDDGAIGVPVPPA